MYMPQFKILKVKNNKNEIEDYPDYYLYEVICADGHLEGNNNAEQFTYAIENHLFGAFCISENIEQTGDLRGIYIHNVVEYEFYDWI